MFLKGVSPKLINQAIKQELSFDIASNNSNTIIRNLNCAIWQSGIAVGNSDSSDSSNGQPLSQSSPTRTNYTGTSFFWTATAMSTFKMVDYGVSVRGAGLVSTAWPNAIIYKATLRYHDGTQYVYLQMTKNSSTAMSINPNDSWSSDEVTIIDHNGDPYTLPALSLVKVLGAVYFSSDGVTAGAIISQGRTSAYENVESCKYNTTFATIDSFLAGGAQDGTNYNSGMYIPKCITGAYTTQPISCGFLGDSIGCGNVDQTAIAQSSIGWVHSFCKRKNFAYINYSRHSRQLKHIYDDANGINAFDVKQLAQMVTYLFIILGANDIANARTLADFKTHLGTVISYINTNAPQCKVIVVVPFPHVTGARTSLGAQTPTYNSLAIRQWLRSESGATPIADLAALGATVYRIDDPSGRTGIVGISTNQQNYSVEYMPAGLSSGKWTVADNVSCGDFTVTAQGDFNLQKKFKASALTASLDDLWKVIGGYLTFTGGANNGSTGLVQLGSVNSYLQLTSNLSNSIAVNDTGKLTYYPGSDLVHPGTMEHRLLSYVMEQNSYL